MKYIYQFKSPQQNPCWSEKIHGVRHVRTKKAHEAIVRPKGPKNLDRQHHAFLTR